MFVRTDIVLKNTGNRCTPRFVSLFAKYWARFLSCILFPPPRRRAHRQSQSGRPCDIIIMQCRVSNILIGHLWFALHRAAIPPCPKTWHGDPGTIHSKPAAVDAHFGLCPDFADNPQSWCARDSVQTTRETMTARPAAFPRGLICGVASWSPAVR